MTKKRKAAPTPNFATTPLSNSSSLDASRLVARPRFSFGPGTCGCVIPLCKLFISAIPSPSLCFSPPPKDTRPRPSLSNLSPGADSWTETSRPSTLSTAATRPLGRGGQGPPSPRTTNWLPNHVRRLGFSARLRREGLIREGPKKLGEDGPPLRVRRIFQTLGSSNHSHTFDVCLLEEGTLDSQQQSNLRETGGRCLGSTFILAGPHIFVSFVSACSSRRVWAEIRNKGFLLPKKAHLGPSCRNEARPITRRGRGLAGPAPTQGLPSIAFQLRINRRSPAFSLHTQTLRPVTANLLISGLPKINVDLLPKPLHHCSAPV